MHSHSTSRPSVSRALAVALAGSPLGLFGCADSAHTARPLSPTAPAAHTTTQPESSAPAVTLTPVAQPAPGPMPADSANDPAAIAPAPTSPDFRVFDAERLRAATHCVVETDADPSADRFWTDLLAQMLDLTVSESLPPAPSTVGTTDPDSRSTVLLLRVRVDRNPAAAFSGASCRVDLLHADRPLATFFDASAPARLSANSSDQSEADLGRAVVRFWAEDLAQRLDALRTAR